MRRVFIVLVGLAFLTQTLRADDWTQFRGPNGSGVSQDKGVPAKWSESENVAWKIKLPGPGSSSPIVLKDRVYVTCFTGADGDTGNVSQLKRHVICIDRSNGKIIWNEAIAAEQPEDPYQGMITQHGYASHTPVTDGEHLFVFFGKSGLVAFDLNGKKLWQQNLGKESSRMAWGSGASPILYKDFVIATAVDESQSVRALDKKTGKEVWKAEASSLESVYATPVLVSAGNGGQELVIAAQGELWGLNPDNGKLQWYAVTGIQGTLSASPVVNNGIIYVQGGRGNGGLAIRAGGKDDVTKSHIVWKNRVSGSIPSHLLHDGHLYSVDGRGIARCVNVQTGKSEYQKRLPGLAGGRQRGGQPGGGRGGFGGGRGGFGGSPIYASPVCADGKIYVVTRHAGTIVLAAKPDFEQIAVNVLAKDKSQFNASPAISNGQLFLRSDEFLYCIASP